MDEPDRRRELGKLARAVEDAAEAATALGMAAEAGTLARMAASVRAALKATIQN